MILQYTVENFYSFREPAVVDFTVPAQAGDRPGLLTSESGHRVNAVTAVLGANASGKTNLLKPLGFLKWFLTNSAQSKPKKEISCEPFDFTLNPGNTPIRLSLHFEHKGEQYLYQLAFTCDRVLEESLHRKKQRFAFLFERLWNPEIGEYDFKAQDLGPTAQVPLRENASWISCALLQTHPFALELLPFLENLGGNVEADGRLPTQEAEYLNVFESGRYFSERPNLLTKASKIMSNFDLGLSSVESRSFKTTTIEGKETDIQIPMVLHRLPDDQTFMLPLMQESRGTQSLFVLLRYLLPVLENGGIAFIDEFESGLHPHMVKAVVDLFFNPATNPKQAQLIATFHTDYLLKDTLNKYQTYLVEKDKTLNSVAYRLDSIRQAKGGKAPRNVDNLYDKYHAGAYGGIPDLV